MPNLTHDKRIEALLKKEMAEHQHIISSHHKEMQTLRDSMNLAMERFTSLYEHSENQLKVMNAKMEKELQILKEKELIHESLIGDQRQTILSLFQQLHDCHIVYCRKSDIESFKNDMESKINESTKNYLSSFQMYEQDLKSMVISLKDAFLKLKSLLEDKIGALNERMENKFCLMRLDKEGVLKEIRIYEKSMFIIEKKIENIYTLIDRLTKRTGTCRKQE